MLLLMVSCMIVRQICNGNCQTKQALWR